MGLNVVIVCLHLLHVVRNLNSVHHVVAGLLLHIVLRSVALYEGRQSLWLALLELLVDGLLVSNGLEELVNLVVLNLKLTFFDRSLGPLLLRLLIFLGALDSVDVLLVVM